jgi:uncharacterized DUF497 family protein
VDGEQRWTAIGWGGLSYLVFVAHMVKDETGCVAIRIISARRADPEERYLYEENRDT